MSEQEQFLEDLEPKDKKENKLHDLFESPLQSESGDGKNVVQPEKGDEEEDPANPKSRDNREARRAKKALQDERQASALVARNLADATERLERITGAQKAAGESNVDYLKSIERIFGTDSPEAVAATELLRQAFQGVEESAYKRSLETIRAEQREAQEAVSREESNLDSMVEEIEDEYDVDLSSSKGAELRKAFFKRLERLSPKDADGNILHFADHRAVWEDLQTQIQKRTDNNRAKDLSARSMVNSNSSGDSKLKQTAEEKLLKEYGIL